MSARIKRNFDKIRVLQKADGKLRKAVIDNSNVDLILALCEIIENTLSGTVKLTDVQKSKLRKHGAMMRKVANRSVPIKAKKKLLVQKGGFLSVLLPPAISLLTALISNAARS